MKLTKTLLKKHYNASEDNSPCYHYAKIQKTPCLRKDMIMVYTTQCATDKPYVYSLSYFNIQSVRYNKRKNTLESTQICKNPNAVLNYIEYLINIKNK